MTSHISDDTRYVDALKVFFTFEKRDLVSAYKFYCNKELEDAHAAEQDINATLEVLNSQIDRYNIHPTVDSLHSISNTYELIDFSRKFARNDEGEIIFTFGKHKGEIVQNHLDYLNWMLSADFSRHTKMIIEKIFNDEI